MTSAENLLTRFRHVWVTLSAHLIERLAAFIFLPLLISPSALSVIQLDLLLSVLARFSSKVGHVMDMEVPSHIRKGQRLFFEGD